MLFCFLFGCKNKLIMYFISFTHTFPKYLLVVFLKLPGMSGEIASGN